MNVFRSEDRGAMNIGWLNTKYSFSFANWYNEERMDFGKLRVFNDDWIKPDGKFDMHPHSNMEIVTIVLKGAVTHEDSMGNKSKIGEGKIQVMSAGSGVVHSEANEEDEDLHLYQIWIEPSEHDITPRYEEARVDWINNKGFTKLVSGTDREGVIKINQDTEIFSVNLGEGKEETYQIKNGRGVFLFVISGVLKVGEETIYEGDSIEIEEENSIILSALSGIKAILIDTVLD